MVAIRSLARVAFFVSVFSLTAFGCGRSWLDDVETDGGVTDGGPEGGPHDGGPDTGVCGPSTCPSGCCTSGGVCISGSTPNACGEGGVLCADCTTEGFSICDAQTHQCENTVDNCTSETCSNGCCAGNLCISGTSIAACGDFGDVCQNCGQLGLTCQGQQCTQSGCGPENCAGCCFGNQCIPGLDPGACGFQGQQCQNCLGVNEQCAPLPQGGGICEGVISTCNDMNCPGGCCDPFGNCQSGTLPTACGANAIACQNCLQIGTTCEFQECIPNPPCNFQTCPNGCCDVNGFCESGQSSLSCGDFGNSCQNCASFGDTCNGQECSFDAGACSPETCPNGCCDVNGFCESGQFDTSCGNFGFACQNCEIFGDTCGGQECVFVVDAGCSPQNCQGGCCDSSGVCQGGTLGNACGVGGNACRNCTQVGEICDASQVCEVPPPPCTPTSCANGCCDANGVCEAGFLDTACGQGGAMCANCTSSGTTCDTAVTPRVCNSSQMTCPAPYSSCPPNLTPPTTITSTSCTANDLDNAAAACATGAHTTQCQQFLQFENANDPSCGACLQQFDYDLGEVQGALACIAPFITDPTCENSIACLDQCETESCAMCSSGATESCEGSVEQGQCTPWTTQVQCTFPAFEGNGSVCNPGNYSSFGAWLQAVGQTYCQ